MSQEGDDIVVAGMVSGVEVSLRWSMRAVTWGLLIELVFPTDLTPESETVASLEKLHPQFSKSYSGNVVTIDTGVYERLPFPKRTIARCIRRLLPAPPPTAIVRK